MRGLFFQLILWEDDDIGNSDEQLIMKTSYRQIRTKKTKVCKRSQMFLFIY